MNENILFDAVAIFGVGKWGYSHPSQTGHWGITNLRNGQVVPLVDCSGLVGMGLRSAGYGNAVGSNFYTGDLFTSTMRDGASWVDSTHFDYINNTATFTKGSGTLQIGDILMWYHQTPGGGTEEHIGIVYGYDTNGNVVFYASGGSGNNGLGGPKFYTLPLTNNGSVSGSYWNSDGTPYQKRVNGVLQFDSNHNPVMEYPMVFCGAARVKPGNYDPTSDNTAALFGSVTTGAGMCLPGQQPADPNAKYCEIPNLTDKTVTRVFENGATYTYYSPPGTSIGWEQWVVPDSTTGGNITYTRYIYDPYNSDRHFSDWIEQQSAPDNTVVATNTIASTPMLAFAGGVNPGNPFLNPSVAQSYALSEATGNPTSLSNQSLMQALGATTTLQLFGSANFTTAQSITVSGGGKNLYICKGDSLVPFDANGNLTLTIPAGQDHITVTLVDTSNSNTPDNVTLKASYADANGNPITSNNLTVTFNQPGIATTTATPDHTINGDLNPLLNASGGYQYDSLGNIITDGTPSANFNDTLYGSATGNDLINTGGGNNLVYAGNGANTINGGAGNDLISAGNGANLINGGGGADIIIAGGGNNQIYANSQVDLATALSNQKATATSATNQKGDLIAVGGGTNTIVGGNANDAIFTGGGSTSTIILGNGKNNYVGGVNVTSAASNWYLDSNHIFQNVGAACAPFTPPPGYNGSTFNGAAVGVTSDTIFGGAGDSRYLLSNGNNWLDAGGGNDLIQAGVGIIGDRPRFPGLRAGRAGSRHPLVN